MIKKIINALLRLNPLLPELCITIVSWGCFTELVGVWFVQDKLRYTTGLLIGTISALLMAISIAKSVYDTDGKTEKQAKAFNALSSGGRYAVVTIVVVLMAYFKLGNIISWFIGIMGLKASAYAQPLIHRLINKRSKEENVSIFQDRKGGE